MTRVRNRISSLVLIAALAAGGCSSDEGGADTASPSGSDGDPWSVLTVDVLREVFGIEASIVPDPHSERPMIVPFAAAERRRTVD
ncbi:MAG: hypothetical protein AAGE98_05525 [Actinomycetota bacterium]